MKNYKNENAGMEIVILLMIKSVVLQDFLPSNITEQDQSETYNSAIIVCTFTSPSKDFLKFPFLS